MKSTSEIRAANARALLDQECGGNQAEFERRINRKQSQVWRLFRVENRKPIGSRLARHIEACFGKPENWMDQDHSLLYQLPVTPTRELNAAAASWQSSKTVKARDLIAEIADGASTGVLAESDLEALLTLVRKLSGQKFRPKENQAAPAKKNVPDSEMEKERT